MLAVTADDLQRHRAVDETIVGERLADLGGWEFYRFASKDGDEAVCVVALSPGEAEVAYGVYRAMDGEPSASGAIARAFGSWSDTAREEVLREILAAYRRDLPALAASIEIDLGRAEEEG
jgi:hypothetical protein